MAYNEIATKNYVDNNAVLKSDVTETDIYDSTDIGTTPTDEKLITAKGADEIAKNKIYLISMTSATTIDKTMAEVRNAYESGAELILKATNGDYYRFMFFKETTSTVSYKFRCGIVDRSVQFKKSDGSYEIAKPTVDFYLNVNASGNPVTITVNDQSVQTYKQLLTALGASFS